MTERILRHDADGLCTLRLNRPEKLNALDTQTFNDLEVHLDALEQQTDTIGCVVLRGEGRAFCAGADLNSIDSTLAAYKTRLVERLGRLPQPTIAAVHGVCFTGGLELVLACDLILADASAKFADTHGKWGLVGAWGMTQRLPRRVGGPAAKLMMYTSRTVEAQEAKALGLADVLVGEGELEAALAKLTAQILANSWHTNYATKRLMMETDGMSLAEGLSHEHFRYPGLAPDYKERIASFGKK